MTVHGDLLRRATCSVQQPYHRCEGASHTTANTQECHILRMWSLHRPGNLRSWASVSTTEQMLYEGPDVTSGRRAEYDSPLASVVSWLTSGAFRPARRTGSRDMDGACVNDVSSSHDALLSYPAQIVNALTSSGSAACSRLPGCMVSVSCKFASFRRCAKPKSIRRKPDGTNLGETASVKTFRPVYQEAMVDVTSCTAKLVASNAPLRSRTTPGQDGLFAAYCYRLRCRGINGHGVQEGLWCSLLCRI